MAIPTNHIDKITDHDSGESRHICPPAEHVSVDNENYEGETLDEVLDEVAQAIEEAGQGGYAPPEGGIPKSDLAQSVQDSLDKADSALQDEDVAEVAKTGDYDDLQNKPTIPDTSNLATKTELATKQDTLVAGNGITIAQDGKTVSVDAEVVQPVTADGTFTIRIGNNIYTINLNHNHPNMAKLIVCEESDLPSTLAMDTIYAQVDDSDTPTEIEKLWIAGLEFVGGGVPDTGEPMISSPSNGSTINLGENSGSGVSKTITIKGKHLTGDLTVAVGTGLELSYGQTLNASSVTIPMAQALLGAQVTISYSGSGALADGSLVISHGNDVLSTVVVVVVEYFPAGYTKLSSISGITDFITTNINAQGTTWEFDVVAGSQTIKTEILAKYDNGESGTALVGGKFACGMINGMWGLGSTYATSVPKTTRSTIVLAFTSSQISMTIGNETVTRPTNDTTDATLYLLGAPDQESQNIYRIRGSIYSVKCTSGASFNGIPAKRNSDNKEGIYDLSNDVFYPLK